MDYVKKYFPDGCPLCQGQILFNKDNYSYQCVKCQAYVSAHRKDSDFAEQGEPQGYIANKAINLLRKAVTAAMTPLYREQVKVKGRHALIDTSLINVIYKDFCIKVILDDDEIVYATMISESQDGNIKVKLVETGQILDVPEEDVQRVSNKEKTYIWFARQLGLPIRMAHIKRLNENELNRAVEVLTKGVAEARQMAINSS